MARGAPLVEAQLFKTEVSLTEIALVSPAQAQVELTSTGYVVPQVEVDRVVEDRGPRRQGEHPAKGAWSRTGQVLFVLDASDQRVAVASAQARVAAARARAATARAQLAEIVLQRDRERRLADTGAVAPASAEDLAARAQSLEEQVHAADADVTAAAGRGGALATNLANTTIRAPIDGTVITKPLLPGDVVSPGTPMAKIADFSSIVVETDVPEARLHLVSKGRPCEIVLDAYPDKRWRGEVVEVSPQLNRAKASATVKVRFLDRDATVLPEMAARVSLPRGARSTPSQLKEPPKHDRARQRRRRARREPRSCSSIDQGSDAHGTGHARQALRRRLRATRRTGAQERKLVSQPPGDARRRSGRSRRGARRWRTSRS